MNRLKVDAGYIPVLGFFSPEILGAKGDADYALMRLIQDRLGYVINLTHDFTSK